MSSSRNALGRGLGALLPGATPSPATTPTGVTAPAPASPAAHASPTSELPLDAIDPNPEQPRRVFDDGPIETLANSIRIHGVLQPVVVRRAGERYELVVGELDLDPQDRLEVALVENIQRRDLNPMELAVAFQTLTDSGATQEEVGRRVGMDRSSVSNYLRLLELPRPIQGDVEQGRLSMGHAKALLQESNAERRTRLRDRIVEEDLSVRAAEDLARGKPRQNRTRRERAPRDPNLERLADSLRERLQTRVRITGNGERGRIEIEYFGPEDLTRLTGALVDEVSPVG
jgi:ParB family chromosome partitioning protein